MGDPRLKEIQDRRFPNGADGVRLLAGRRRSRQSKNSSADDGANADAGKSERPECALQLALGRSRFGYQKLRAFGLEKIKGHRFLLVRNSIQTLDCGGS